MSNEIHTLARAVILDDEHILLCKTLDLPVNFYFLPGGHVEHGESASQALMRELKEETGKDCTVKRFLGCLEYSFEPGHNSICHNHEYNFIFEAESDQLKVREKISSPEKHIELIWVAVSDLSEIDFRADPLKKLLPEWLSRDAHNVFRSEMI
ncbi:MAG: DNA mismatch repair protein MutT [Rickettsiales bacterium]|nr:MAG: DNA mismatch repair protein MutT [Rickettsiales bacterium]